MRGISATSDSRTVIMPSGSGSIILNSANKTNSTSASILPALYLPLNEQDAEIGSENQNPNVNTPSCPVVCLSTAIQPGTAATVVVMASLSKANHPHPCTEICVQVLNKKNYEMTSAPLMLPLLDANLSKSESKASLFEAVRASSLVVQMEFCSHDPTLLAVTESFMSAEDAVNHRLHLLRVSKEEGGGEVLVELLNSHSLRDYLALSEIGGVMEEASDLLDAINLEGEEGGGEHEEGTLEDNIMDIMQATDKRLKGRIEGAEEGKNKNDEALHSRKVSVAWVPATRSLVSVQWGEVWYWSAKGSGGNPGLNLDNQDCHDIRVRTNGVTSVASSLTSVFLPPLKRLQSYTGGGGDADSKRVPAEDDVVILVCGSAPAKLLKIDSSPGSTDLVATVSCEIKDEARRKKTGFTCACICGKYILVGTTDGSILVAGVKTFEFEGERRAKRRVKRRAKRRAKRVS
jgi:hypothetical protein